MAFVSVHGSITAAQVSTTASVVGNYTKLRVACTGGGGFYFSFAATATNQGSTSAFCSLTASVNNAWDFNLRPTEVVGMDPAPTTTTVSLYSNITNAAYSITGYV